jgi:adenylate cyclase class 2
MPNETEIKLPLADVRAGRSMLRAAGYHVSKRRVFEANTVFDTGDLALRKSQRLLRLREAGGVATLTYKGPPLPSRHKSREEIETALTRAGEFASILQRLGFRRVWRYEKYRTEFRQERGGGVATLDETPIGVFLELEGNSRWIDRTARELGFKPEQYILSSYGRLFQDRSKRAGDMVFR